MQIYFVFSCICQKKAVNLHRKSLLIYTTMSNFSAQDLEQLQARGISVEKAEAQLECFRTGFPELDIVAPASTKKGILAPKRAEQEEYIAAWQAYLKEGHKILKFVPASGAASRMFKNLFQYLEDGIETPFIQDFLAHKDCFAFGPQLAGRRAAEGFAAIP